MGVVAMPKVEITPQSPVEIEENSRQQFTCYITVQTNWRLVGFYDSSDPRTSFVAFFYNTGSCNFDPLSDEDKAIYEINCGTTLGQFHFTIKSVTKKYHKQTVECVAQYGTGSSSDIFVRYSAVIIVIIPLKSIKIFPDTSPIAIQRDEIKRFTCDASTRPLTNVIWKIQRNGQSFEDMAPHEEHVNGTTVKSFLNYTGTETDDRAVIFCIGQYNGSEIKSTKIRLEIIYAPNTELSINQVPALNIITGDYVNLTCKVSGGNPSPQLAWNCSGITRNNSAGNEASYSVLFTVDKSFNNRICTCYVSVHPVLSYRPTKQQLIVVFYPPDKTPTIQSTPASNIFAGQSITLLCTVSGGNPLPTLSWNCTGHNHNSTSGPNASHSIAFIVKATDDNKICTCLATQLITSYQRHVDHTLVVYYAPNESLSIEVMPERDITAGENVTLMCTVLGGNPLATLSWNCTGHKTNHNSGSKAESRVVFTVDQTYNNMICTCLASHPVISYRPTIQYKLVVHFGPGSSLQFDPSNTFLTKKKGDKLGPIECTATCNRPCHFKWSKPDKTIINGDELTMESLSTHDHGTFICTASNGLGDSQKNLHVTVKYGPVVVTLSTPTNQYTVRYGQNIPPIDCTANCRPVCQYMWSGPNVPSDTKHVLSLENIKKNQSGDFYCTAANEIGRMQSSIINVNVEYEPIVHRVTINGTNFTVSENTTVILSCNYEGNPAPKITWKKNDIILNEDDENTGRSFYTINTVRCEDPGNYSCVANNSLGLSSVQQSLFVTCFPRLNVYKQQPPKRIRLSIGESLNLTVHIIAYPKLLKSNWTFQPSTLSDDERSNNYTTSLKSDLFTQVAYFYKYHLKNGDFGNYTLEIQNDIGGIVVHFYVDRAGLPDPPTDLLVICQTSPMVVLWKSGFDGGTPQRFTVIWKDIKTNTSIVSSSIPDTDNGQYVKVTTSSLSDGTTYSIYVEASNKYGRVRATMYDNCTTKSAQFIQTENYAAVGVGAGIGTSLIILILAAIVVFIFKRLRRRKNTESNAIYEATQSGSRELSANEDHLYNDLQQCQGDNTNKHRDPATYANLSF